MLESCSFDHLLALADVAPNGLFGPDGRVAENHCSSRTIDALGEQIDAAPVASQREFDALESREEAR